MQVYRLLFWILAIVYVYYVGGEVLAPVRSHEGGSPKGVSRRVFPNLKRTHKYGNLPVCKQLSFNFLTSFPFCRKEIFPWEHGNIWNWGAVRHNALLLGEIPQNTHRNKKGVAYAKEREREREREQMLIQQS